jgi:hypothetical protein
MAMIFLIIFVSNPTTLGLAVDLLDVLCNGRFLLLKLFDSLDE